MERSMFLCKLRFLSITGEVSVRAMLSVGNKSLSIIRNRLHFSRLTFTAQSVRVIPNVVPRS